MEGDIADRFVTVEYKTYANRSVKREIRRRCDVTCRVYNDLLDIAMTAIAEDGHVPDRYGMQTMITQMRAEDALIRSVAESSPPETGSPTHPAGRRPPDTAQFRCLSPRSESTMST